MWPILMNFRYGYAMVEHKAFDTLALLFLMGDIPLDKDKVGEMSILTSLTMRVILFISWHLILFWMVNYSMLSFAAERGGRR